MRRNLSVLFLFVSINSLAQNISIDTLSIFPSGHQKELPYGILNYPLIKTSDYLVDSLINYDIKNKFTHNEYVNESIDSSVYKWAEDGIVYIDFKVTYTKNGIISLHISAEGCGAYCTGWTEYFNYSVQTGKPLYIDSVIDITDGFRDLVFKQRKNQYEKQKQELKKMLVDKESELDSSSYETAIEHYKECYNSFSIETFSLQDGYLEIIETCDMPQFIQNLAPIIELKYKYSDILKYLKLKELLE